MFVEDDTKRDGDDNDSSARNRHGADWEDVSVVNGLPKGSSRNASLGSDTVLDISCGPCVRSSASYWSSIALSFCFQSEIPEDWHALEYDFFSLSLSSTSSSEVPTFLLLSSESGMTSSAGAMLE